jgi:hypothetical protein
MLNPKKKEVRKAKEHSQSGTTALHLKKAQAQKTARANKIIGEQNNQKVKR